MHPSLSPILGSETSPILGISQVGGKIVITWPEAGSGFALQAADSLAPAQWKAAGLTSTLENGLNKVTVSPASSAK